MEKKATDTVVVDINERTVVGFASVSGVLDSYNDIIQNGAFTKTLKENYDRIKFLWMHDFREVPPATIKDIVQTGKAKLPQSVRDKFPEATGGLMVTREYLPTTRGDELLAAIKSTPPAITEMSIGYDPIVVKYEEGPNGEMIRQLKELRLWDLSDVPWGANEATVAQKSIIPFKETPKADESREWDTVAEKQKAITAELKIISALYDDDRSAPMYLHHEVEEGYPVNINGVKSAMAELMSSNIEESLSPADRRSVYNHLKKHYEQFDQKPPNFKLLDLVSQAKEILTQDKELSLFLPLEEHIKSMVAGPVSLKVPPTSQDLLRAAKARLDLARRIVNY